MKLGDKVKLTPKLQKEYEYYGIGKIINILTYYGSDRKEITVIWPGIPQTMTYTNERNLVVVK